MSAAAHAVAVKAAIYARASTKEQVQSCDGQIRECTVKAKALGLSISTTFVDNGISGTRHDRPPTNAGEALESGDRMFYFSSRTNG